MRGSRVTSMFLGAALVAGIAGCAPGSGSTSGSPVATTEVRLPPSYKFEPAAITVNAGSTVTWTNSDNFTHSVQFEGGGLPTDPMVMSPGQQVAFTFTTPGTYPYRCSFHPQDMRGTVTVTG